MGTPQIGAIVRGRGLLIARSIAAVGHGTTGGLVTVTLRSAAGATLAATLGWVARWRIALRRITGRRVARWCRTPTTSTTGATIIGCLGGHFETGVHTTGIAMPDFHRGIGHRIIARPHHAALHVLHPNHELQRQTGAVLGDIAADGIHIKIVGTLGFLGRRHAAGSRIEQFPQLLFVGSSSGHRRRRGGKSTGAGCGVGGFRSGGAGGDEAGKTNGAANP